MDSVNGSHVLSQPTPESLFLFSEGISLILSRWTALQMAVVNEWGGRDARKKSEQLAVDIFSWFSQTKAPLYIDDLENMLDEKMLLYFLAEIEDGSIDEVAEQLMIMHEDALKGNYESIENLRRSNSGTQAVSQSIRMVNDDSSDDEASDMVVDEPDPNPNPHPNPKGVSMDGQPAEEKVELEDGWTVVAPKRKGGKRV